MVAVPGSDQHLVQAKEGEEQKSEDGDGKEECVQEGADHRLVDGDLRAVAGVRKMRLPHGFGLSVED